MAAKRETQDESALRGEFSSRLEDLLREKSLSQADLCRLTGESTSTISGYVRGLRMPSAATAIAIADALGVTVPYLILGRGNGPEPLHAGLNWIPFTDMRLSAGPGAYDTADFDNRKLSFSDEELAELGKSSIHGLKAFRASGDSMQPTIPDAGIVLVDELDIRLREGIFAFRLGDDLRIKRLRPVGIGGIEARSDNPLYPPEVFDGDQREHFKIIGRVIWVGGPI